MKLLKFQICRANSSTVILIVATLLSFSCQRTPLPERSITPGDQYLLSPPELAQFQERAKSGDLQAVQKLILHYELAAPNRGEAMHWQRVAVDMGDLGAMLNLATYLQMQGGEQPCREALELLQRAKKSALADEELKRRVDKKQNLLMYGIQGKGECVGWLQNRPN
jgi:hypothetical protein